MELCKTCIFSNKENCAIMLRASCVGVQVAACSFYKARPSGKQKEKPYIDMEHARPLSRGGSSVFD